VRLSKGQQIIEYDILVVATGCEIRPDQIDGMVNGAWRKTIFDFYTLEGASALAGFLDKWKGGRLVVNVAELPIKCPVAPLEFLFLADAYFQRKGMRDKVELVFSTPQENVFAEPGASSFMNELFYKKGIHVEAGFDLNSVDGTQKTITSWKGKQLDYDLLVSIPTNMGVEAIERSEMGDDLNFIPTDKYTLQSRDWENVWVVGDAGDLPAAKSGSAAHYMLDSLEENIQLQIRKMPPKPSYDGHASFFIETGFERGVMLDYNYEFGPLPGSFPVPGLGPFRLLRESKSNHLGKLAFRWLYWNRLLPARGGMGPSQMSLAGKSA
jgi:sulfide:quinone oxidoreductase